MPSWVENKLARLEKIRKAKAALGAEAKEKADRIKAERARKEEELGHRMSGYPPKAMNGIPEDKAQKNFTDPESRVLRAGNTDLQGYTCLAAVDAEHQVIVGQDVSERQDDHDDFLPVLGGVAKDAGRYPAEASADSGYCSEANLEGLEARGIRGYVATGRREHRMATATNNERAKRGPHSRAMRARLRRGGWRSRYRLRKQVVEPVFGQIKEARRFRRFLLRGLKKVQAEWALLCTAHNLLKLAKARARQASSRHDSRDPLRGAELRIRRLSGTEKTREVRESG